MRYLKYYSRTPEYNKMYNECVTEWHHGQRGHLLLQQEDITTKCSNGWRRVNTLAHYGIRDVAVMKLVPRQSPTMNGNCPQPCVNCKYFTCIHFISHTSLPT